ncbi:alpha/beta hydrolase [Marinobacter salinisoli]|uniref:Alpha/beta hydrolase n=1 Tax=Marinobacter salinisoli TaxID=2769486 RepID=A0ABX7MRF5_9GAMM|nr:alpha/beta hydrolase [Marinobacter salinisoli]QSP93686.1 alpha/beta hydrolase [Marinobacter salinisoli]
MREQVVTVGHERPLVGIFCEPSSADMTDSRTAVILLNSGVIHRVGSCRLTVTLARAIAQTSGLSTFRFDFSGIGDSEARRGTLTAEQAAVEEVQEVMDHLSSWKQYDRFILYGLCSGAFAAYRTALEDPRVSATVQLDGYCYMTPKSYLLHYSRRLSSPGRWIKFLLRKLGLFKIKRGAELSGIDEQFFEVPDFASYPPKEDVAKGLEQLNLRNLQMLYVFMGNEHYKYETQFLDCFSSVPFKDNLKIIHQPLASHILSEPADRQTVVEAIAAWVKSTSRKLESHQAPRELDSPVSHGP